MDKNHITTLLELSIELELGAGSLYELFAALYQEDRDFWSQLHVEEKNHATLLRAALDSFSNRGMLPTNIITSSVDDLRTTTRKLKQAVDQYKTKPPSRKDTFRVAIRLEEECGEKHYEQFMEKEPESILEKVFQQLNREDKDHINRIEKYFASLSAELTV